MVKKRTHFLSMMWILIPNYSLFQVIKQLFLCNPQLYYKTDLDNDPLNKCWISSDNNLNDFDIKTQSRYNTHSYRTGTLLYFIYSGLYFVSVLFLNSFKISLSYFHLYIKSQHTHPLVTHNLHFCRKIAL